MGIIAKISHESNEYTLSLVKWGFIRKVMAKIFKASPFMFIPSYELAIYERKESGLKYNNPCFVFHFSDKEMATSRMNWAKELIESGGMASLIEHLHNLDPKREGIYSDLTDYIEKGGLF